MIRILREDMENIKEIPLECIKGATLLSTEEAENLLTKEERICKGTWKAIENGLWCASDGTGSYWLRSVDGYGISFCYVRYDGDVCYDDDVGDVGEEIGIRHALVISNLQSSNLKKGDRFEFGDYTFKIISNNLALCDVIIDTYPFRKDWEAEDANIYEESDVKKYVDRWFNQIMNDYENKSLGLKTDDEIFNDDFDF